jgi:hypothetical protein
MLGTLGWFLAALLTFSASLSNAAGTFCFGPFCTSAGTDSRPAVPLLYADPGVRVERSPQGEVPYRSAMELQIGDIVQTAAGYAVIDYGDDNVVALRDNTRVQLGSIKLFLGEVFARISQIAQRGGGQVTTDELSASVKGTEYSVRRSPVADRADIGNTSVIVRRGRVLCEDPARRWAPQELPENNIFQVKSGETPQPPQYVNAQAATAWADDALRRLLTPTGPRPNFNIIVPPSQPHRDPPRDRTPAPTPAPKRPPSTSDGPRSPG